MTLSVMIRRRRMNAACLAKKKQDITDSKPKCEYF